MKRNTLTYLIILLVGAALGALAMRTFAPSTPQATTADSPKRVHKIDNRGDRASVEALRKRIAELERQLAQKNGSQQEIVSNAVAEALRNAPRGRMHEPPHERMERLKTEDPVRYARMTNFFARARRDHASRERRKMAFLASVDTSHMSSKAKATHAQYQEMSAAREDLERQLTDPNLTNEQRHEIMQQMHQSGREMRTLANEERNVLIEETAHALGFSGDDAKEMTMTMQDIISATETQHGGGMPPPGPPPGL